MSWRGFRWLGTDSELAADNRAHAARIASALAADAAQARREAELHRATLVAKGRC